MPKNIPQHLAIIMDGNRRWARRQGLPTLEGHQRGYEKMKEVGQWCLDRGIKILTVWAFSTDNWKRSKNEVAYLMRLLKRAFTSEIEAFNERGIQLRVIGRLEGLPQDLERAAEQAIAATKNNKKGILNVAINYGGREEIVDVVKRVVKKGLPVQEIDAKVIEENLYTQGLADPDLIIRTSGERRLSGFLPWQGVYSELYFCPTYWPDFSEADLEAALAEYARRARRRGR